VDAEDLPLPGSRQSHRQAPAAAASPAFVCGPRPARTKGVPDHTRPDRVLTGPSRSLKPMLVCLLHPKYLHHLRCMVLCFVVEGARTHLGPCTLKVDARASQRVGERCTHFAAGLLLDAHTYTLRSTLQVLDRGARAAAWPWLQRGMRSTARPYGTCAWPQLQRGAAIVERCSNTRVPQQHHAAATTAHQNLQH